MFKNVVLYTIKQYAKKVEVLKCNLLNNPYMNVLIIRQYYTVIGH